jgi:hypothetical protein
MLILRITIEHTRRYNRFAFLALKGNHEHKSTTQR